MDKQIKKIRMEEIGFMNGLELNLIVIINKMRRVSLDL